MTLPIQFRLLEQLDSLAGDEVVDDRRVRLRTVDALLADDDDRQTLISTELGRQAVGDEIIATLQSVRENPGQPLTVLHALAIDDFQTSAMIAARIGQEPPSVRWILTALENNGLVTRRAVRDRADQFVVNWLRVDQPK